MSYLRCEEPYQPPQAEIKFVYQSSSWIAVNKPAGILSVPGRGLEKQDCLVSRLQQTFPTLRVVHRLDCATSGLILFALTANTQRVLSLAFQNKQVHKSYHAWVEGCLSDSNGAMNFPLITDWEARPKQKVDWEAGKSAYTEWEKDKCFDYQGLTESMPVTQVRLYPRTGRSHQLRVHLAEIGYPILGDKLYAKQFDQTNRMHLHATHLAFMNPDTRQPIFLEAQANFIEDYNAIN